MTPMYRESSYCAELDRTADELVAFAAIPRALRVQRLTMQTRGTVDRYVTAAATFAVWARENGRAALNRNPSRAADTVRAFLVHQHEVVGWTACKTLWALTAIDAWYHSCDVPRPENRALSGYCAALRKSHTRVKATPATSDNVKAMCRLAVRQYPPLRAARDIALILFAFTGAERPIEVRSLEVAHLCPEPPKGLKILIPRSKTDREGQGQYVRITPAWDPEFCPIRALERWLDLSEITEGFVFRAIDRHGNVGENAPMCDNAYREILRAYLKAVGLTGKLTGYSMRRGCATSANDAGAAFQDIKAQLRHIEDVTTRGYIETHPIRMSAA